MCDWEWHLVWEAIGQGRDEPPAVTKLVVHPVGELVVFDVHCGVAFCIKVGGEDGNVLARALKQVAQVIAHLVTALCARTSTP